MLADTLPSNTTDHTPIVMREMGRKSRRADSELPKDHGQSHRCRFAMEGRACAAGNSLKSGEKTGRFSGSVLGVGTVIFALGAEMNR
jgi:hypothetical protein